MESIAAVVESSNLLLEILLLLELHSSVTEYLALILGVSEAHIVGQVSDELSLAQVVLLVKLRLFLLEAHQHRLVVGICINQALVVQVLSLLVVGD